MILVLAGEQKEFILTHLQTIFQLAKVFWFLFFSCISEKWCPSFFSRQDTQASHGGWYSTVSLCHLTQHLHMTFPSQSRRDLLKSLLKSLLSVASLSPLATVLQSHGADLIQLVPAWAAWVFIYMGASVQSARDLSGEFEKNWEIWMSSQVFFSQHLKGVITASLSSHNSSKIGADNSKTATAHSPKVELSLSQSTQSLPA